MGTKFRQNIVLLTLSKYVLIELCSPPIKFTNSFQHVTLTLSNLWLNIFEKLYTILQGLHESEFFTLIYLRVALKEEFWAWFIRKTIETVKNYERCKAGNYSHHSSTETKLNLPSNYAFIHEKRLNIILHCYTVCS